MKILLKAAWVVTALLTLATVLILPQGPASSLPESSASFLQLAPLGVGPTEIPAFAGQPLDTARDGLLLRPLFLNAVMLSILIALSARSKRAIYVAMGEEGWSGTTIVWKLLCGSLAQASLWLFLPLTAMGALIAVDAHRADCLAIHRSMFLLLLLGTGLVLFATILGSVLGLAVLRIASGWTRLRQRRAAQSLTAVLCILTFATTVSFSSASSALGTNLTARPPDLQQRLPGADSLGPAILPVAMDYLALMAIALSAAVCVGVLAYAQALATRLRDESASEASERRRKNALLFAILGLPVLVVVIVPMALMPTVAVARVQLALTLVLVWGWGWWMHHFQQDEGLNEPPSHHLDE